MLLFPVKWNSIKHIAKIHNLIIKSFDRINIENGVGIRKEERNKKITTKQTKLVKFDFLRINALDRIWLTLNVTAIEC